MIRKYVLPFLAVIGVAVAILMVIEGNRSGPVAQPTVQPSSTPFSSYIFAPGIVEASTENIVVGTPVPGIVTAIYVKWGDRVKTGDRLFKVDTRDLDAQLPPASAKVKEVRSQLLPAASKVKEAEANLAKTQNRLKVGEGLEPGVSISAEEISNRHFDVQASEANLASAKALVEQIKAQVASAEAQVQQIKAQIEIHIVRAPISGRILQMKTRLGEYAQTGVLGIPLMLVGDDTKLHVRVDIDENDAWRFQPCASAVASLRGNPEHKASLEYVRTDPDVIPKVLLTGDATQRTDTRVLQVVYSFDPASLPLYIGQLTDVFIEAPSASSNATRTQNPAAPCGDVSGRNTQSTKGRKP
jgi:multidrug efflux pump subunit AcrA (membrane-fusion protein)